MFPTRLLMANRATAVCSPPAPGRGSTPLWAASWLHLLVLFTVTFAIYSPSLAGRFLWDDNALITGNPLVRSPIFLQEVFGHSLFPGNTSLHYRPLQTASFIFDYWLWGKDPFGYHLTNLVFQGLSVGLLYTLLKRLLPALVPGQAPRPRAWAELWAFGIALLWAVHPAHNAAIAYIAGRADPMAFMFSALAWLGCERALRSANLGHSLRRTAWALLAAACFFCALASRESAMIWLLIFGFYLFFFQPGAHSRRQVWFVIASALLVLAGYLALRLRVPPPLHTPEVPSFGPGGRILLLFQALGSYAQLLLYPSRLFMDRHLASESALSSGVSPALGHWLLPVTLLGYGVAAMLVVSCRRPGAGRTLRRFGVSWFLAGFLPISNLLTLNASMADHWLYLPSVGLLLVVAGWLMELPAGFALPGPWPSRALTFAGFVVVALGARTYVRSGDWCDARNFYAKTIADGGDNARMRFNLAVACVRAGDQPAAERVLKEISARWPHYSPAPNLLGQLSAKDQPPTESASFYAHLQEQFDRKVWTSTRPASDALQLAKFYVRAQQPERANQIIDEAMRRHPEEWQLVQWKAAFLESVSRPEEAHAQVLSFLHENWWQRDALLYLADLTLRLGDEVGALHTLAWADRLDTHNADALNRVAAIQCNLGQLPRALTAQRAAVRKEPQSPKQHVFLAAIHTSLGETVEAQRQLNIAADLTSAANFPNHVGETAGLDVIAN